MLYPVELGVRGIWPKLLLGCNLRTIGSRLRFAGLTIMPENRLPRKASQTTIFWRPFHCKKLKHAGEYFRRTSSAPKQASHFLSGALEDLGRRTRFGNPTSVHHMHRARDIAGEPHRVRDDDHCLTALRQVGDDANHLGCHARVQRARWFIEQNCLGLHCRPGNRHPLLLAAR